MSADKDDDRVHIITNVAGCVGHARCAAVSQEIYGLNDDGYNVTAERFVPEKLRSLAIRGAKACPEKVIVVFSGKIEVPPG